MDKFSSLTAIGCPLDLSGVDTDQLIPARFMVRSRAQGYGGYLLHDLRFTANGSQRAGFALDLPRFAGAQVLVAPATFGTGSSREAAVYALWDFGIRCVIAPSFGDIFASNASKNGMLTAVVPVGDATALVEYLATAADPGLTVDLEAQTIVAGDLRISFAVDPVRRLQLLNGWDDIDLTLQHGATIAAYKAARGVAVPWAVEILDRGGEIR
jgi:3-isopropylmalate/(R)-2-methylmalate dehydratase small subunit